MHRVSIGLPVYNGENYLETAIRSVLEQSFDDLALVVGDNDSTDRTEEICRDLAATDPRIEYWRNPQNLGAAPNYNLTWGRSRGEYFKWLAHDDRLQPDFVAATVRALDADPGAVLCNTTVEYIDANGDHLGYYRSVLGDATGATPAERLAPLILRSHTCVDFFGMVRRKAMEDSLLHQPFSGADKAFIAQMALRGRVLQLDEPLVQFREHPQRYTRITKTARMKLGWHDTRRSGRVDVPVLTLYRTCRELVENEELSDADRRACRRVLRRFWREGWNSGRLVADLVSVPFPRAVSIAFAIKYRLFGAPGNFLD